MATKDLNLKDRLKKNTRAVAPAAETEAAPVVKTKKKVGRPKTKTEECRTINVAIPVSMLEEMNVAKALYKDNLTLYVNTVIRRDLEANMEKYRKFAEMQEEMK